MKRDYPELEGKEIIYNWDGGSNEAIVIGCNYDIGIAIVNKHDKNDFLHCAPGKMSPNRHRFSNNVRAAYSKTFSAKIKMIEDGVYNVSTITELRKTLGLPTNYMSLSTISADVCSFGA